MSALSTTRQNALILVILLFGQLLLMSGSVRGSDGATRLESWVMLASSPVVTLSQAVSGGVHGSLSSVRNLVTAHARAARLDAEVQLLRSELRLHREAALENGRLRSLLEMKQDLAPRSIGASVVTSVLTPRSSMLVLDRGRGDGVLPDMPVVAWGGAVGRVVISEPRHSKVRLLGDANSGVAGVVQRSRAQGMVFGQGEDRLDFRYVPRFSDIGLGDRVVTSGLDGIFPRGFGIGTIVSVEEQPDGRQTIDLQPELMFAELEEVLVLLESVGGELLSREGLDEESP